MEMHVLKTKWGKYCDTDKLVRDMSTWFTGKGIRNTTQGICAMLNEFFTNKEELIKLFEKSDNYVGDMRIMLDTEMCRYGNRYSISTFVNKFPDQVESKKAILKIADANGKKLKDYIHVGKKYVSVADLVNGSLSNENFSKWEEVFNSDGNTRESVNQYRQFINIINSFSNVCAPVVNDREVDFINQENESIKMGKGIKTSRAFNKVCAAYNVDKLPKYNKLFAEYADMVSESKRKIKFYISVNPLDYLNMSIGRSWKSCHAPGGGYFAGTVSYMLDKTSIITFVHDTAPADIINEGKVYRNMFHYQDGVLIQSRVYPQGNDGCTNLYDEFRAIVQKELAEDLGLQNNWHVCNSPIKIRTTGRHYPDYKYNNGTNASFVGSNPGTTTMEIGHTNICPHCGVTEDISSGKICHSNCLP